jgi:hypothetical protein
MNKNETIIIAAFNDEAAAEAAVENLREWDKRVRDVKLGAIGTVKYDGGSVRSEVVHGGLFNRSMPISKDSERALAQELSDGQVAIVVACDNFEASMVSESLVRDGGRIMVMADERTKEDIAKGSKTVDQALAEDALKMAAAKTKQKGDQNLNRPV